VVGTGVKARQITPDALSCVEHAEKVLFIVTDIITSLWIQKINTTAEDLAVFYQPTDDRQIVYLKNGGANSVLRPRGAKCVRCCLRPSWCICVSAS
jgi:hypothetical protein